MKIFPFLVYRTGTTIKVKERERYRASLLKFREGENFLLIIKKYVPPTTISEREAKARGYYFGVVMPLVAEDTGHSDEYIHEAMKQKFSVKHDDMGLPYIESVFSNDSPLDLEEKWEFIDKVRAFWNDFRDIVTPDPDPEWRKNND